MVNNAGIISVASTTDLLALINRLVLPPPSNDPDAQTVSPGKTALGRAAAKRLNQNA